MGLAERKDGIASALHMSLTNSLDKAVAGAVLEAYNISPTTADDEAMKSILKLATDIAYCAPALAYARSFPGKTYYYQFDEPNLWNGVFKGYATHGLDLVFLLQNFSEKLGEREKHFGKHFAKGFVSFAHGLEPWKGFEGKDGEVKTFGTGNTASGLEGRRDVLFRLQKEGKVNLDSLSVAWDIFVGGKY
jgi:carboxylesterase type B